MVDENLGNLPSDEEIANAEDSDLISAVLAYEASGPGRSATVSGHDMSNGILFWNGLPLARIDDMNKVISQVDGGGRHAATYISVRLIEIANHLDEIMAIFPESERVSSDLFEVISDDGTIIASVNYGADYFTYHMANEDNADDMPKTYSFDQFYTFCKYYRKREEDVKRRSFEQIVASWRR